MPDYRFTITAYCGKDAGVLKPPSEDKEWALLEAHPSSDRIVCIWVERSTAPASEKDYRMQRREIYRVEPDF